MSARSVVVVVGVGTAGVWWASMGGVGRWCAGGLVCSGGLGIRGALGGNATLSLCTWRWCLAARPLAPHSASVVAKD